MTVFNTVSHSTFFISYKTLLKNLPDAALILDNNAIIHGVSDLFLTLVRKEYDDLLKKPLADVLPELNRILSAPDPYSQYFNTTIPYQGRHVQIKRTALTDEDDVWIGELVILSDQTGTRMFQQALMAYERRYRALFDYSHDAIIIIDLDLTIVVANEQSARLLGDGLPTMLQRTMLYYVPPDRVKQFKERCKQVVQGETLPLIEDEMLAADRQTRIPVEISQFLVRDSEQRPLHVQIILRDITERKRAEAVLQERIHRLNKLHEADQQVAQTLDMDEVLRTALDVGIDLSSADGGFIVLRWEEMFLVTHTAGTYPDDVIGLTLIEGVGIIGRVISQRQAELVLDVSQDPNYFPDVPDTQAAMALPLLAHDKLIGAILLETAQVANFTQEAFRLMQLLATRLAFAIENARLYDFSRLQVEELTQLYQQVRKAEALKTDMIRLANHDIKNPLNVIRGYLELLELEHEKLDDETRQYVTEMQQAVRRSEDILKEFLSIDVINERTRGTTLEAVDLAMLTQRLLSEYRPQALAYELALNTPNEMPARPAIVYADRAQLYEAMSNLVTNAIKYTPTGGTIDLTLVLNGANVHFTVTDTGYGIPDEQQNHIFEPFHRPNLAETARIDGSGLGLYLFKNIIERHQGRIIFESVYGQGSIFGFILPLMQAP